MLKRLTVSNLAVVEHAEADFVSGLNVVTGETGAGKSVFMGALELLLGGRADPAAVRDGEHEAEVEAEIGGHIVRRTVTENGRSRAWIDEESVSISELRDFAGKLADIHGPSANLRIYDEGFQRETLDAYGKVNLEEYRQAYRQWREIVDRIAALEGASSTEDELDMLRFQVGELEEASLSTEDIGLSERHAAAAHAEEIVEAANEVTEALGGERGASESLIAIGPRFKSMARHLPVADEWIRKAEELTLELQELSRSVADAVSRLDADPEAFAEMDARLGVINRLKRKYLARRAVEPGEEEKDDIERLMSVLESKRAALSDLERRDERLEELRRSAEKNEKLLREKGADVSAKRAEAGRRLAKAVTRELHDLGFLQAKFKVEVTADAISAVGCDKVIYMFEPNPGEGTRPLAAIASSGEAARVMLALKAIVAVHDATPTLIFDEIDANVGGEIGSVVGHKLREVAKAHQVIAITHLPQSAVYGERHLVVAKSVAGGRTRTNIVAVDGADRISEIARMLGGEKLTSVTRKHAQELLEHGKEKD